MREDQREAARAEIRRMLDWSLAHSIGADGEIAPTAAAEPLGDMYYFAAAFLDTIGYFDKRKRFWTDERISREPNRFGRHSRQRCG